jgi:hypothetical protein
MEEEKLLRARLCHKLVELMWYGVLVTSHPLRAASSKLVLQISQLDHQKSPSEAERNGLFDAIQLWFCYRFCLENALSPPWISICSRFPHLRTHIGAPHLYAVCTSRGWTTFGSWWNAFFCNTHTSLVLHQSAKKKNGKSVDGFMRNR